MKRILPFLLILALIFVQLPMFLAVPVEASSIETPFINLFDYGMPNGADSTRFLIGNGNNDFTFNLPYELVGNYIDLLFVISGVSNFSVSVLSNQLTVLETNANTYRAFGSFYASMSSVTVRVNCTLSGSSYGWIDFFGAKLLTHGSLPVPISVLMDGTTGDGSPFTAPWDPGYGLSVDSVYYSVDSNTDFIAFCTVGNFLSYDYIDLQLYFSVGSIDSISISYGDEAVPFSVSYLNHNTDTIVDSTVNLTIDLRNIRRDLGGDFVITISGDCAVGTNIFGVWFASGFNDIRPLDPEIYWYQTIVSYIGSVISNMSSNNSGVISAIQSAADKIASAFTNGLASSGAGEVIKDKGSQIGGEISAGQAQLDAVNKPSGGDISAVDTLGAVDFTGNTTFLTQIVNTPYIKDVFVFVAILAVVSLVLFGSKKGG